MQKKGWLPKENAAVFCIKEVHKKTGLKRSAFRFLVRPVFVYSCLMRLFCSSPLLQPHLFSNRLQSLIFAPAGLLSRGSLSYTMQKERRKWQSLSF